MNSVRVKTLPTDSNNLYVVPKIEIGDSLADIVTKITNYITRAVDTAYSYDQLRTTIAGQNLKPLLHSLNQDCHNPAILIGLLATRYIFDNDDDSEDARLTATRALACELVAWQFLLFLSRKDMIDHLLYELPRAADGELDPSSAQVPTGQPSEQDHLLSKATRRSYIGRTLSASDNYSTPVSESYAARRKSSVVTQQDDLSVSLAGLNALEIAAVAGAKKFLSQKSVQAVIEDIWHGDIIFWDSLSSDAKKVPKIYNPRTMDPFSRLRVPKYQKAAQIAFFLSFLALYYAVLVQRNPSTVTITEIFLYIWIAAFAYDELGEIQDAGLLFYQTDFWSVWDIAIILVCLGFFILRVIGLARNSSYVTDIAFDVLSMAALFLVPRICSVASLNSYFGSLLPVLKEMTTAFCKFLPVIAILYLGFLTTFTMLARDRLNVKEVSWLLIKVFFGSSYLGFDFAVQISPIFGYTLMVIFVALTNILLITALVSLVSNSLTEVMAHAREEYLFQYSIYVLESCTSRRLTYFLPPTNLIPLLFVRPLRLFLPSDTIRRVRILLLKCVSIPFVALIWSYEACLQHYPSNSSIPKETRIRGLNAALASGPATPRPASVHTSSSPGAIVPRSLSASTSLRLEEAGDLRELVARLSVQVQELTAMVAAQKAD